MNQEQIIEAVEKMTVLELNTLVKAIEGGRWGGFFKSTVAAAGPACSRSGQREGKSTADVELTEVGASKIAVIKAVKEALALGLKEAKDSSTELLRCSRQARKKEDAAELAKKLTDAGAKVTLK